MKYLAVILGITLISGILISATLSESTSESPLKTPENKIVTWLTIEQAFEKNKKEPRKIFIDVYTDWCGWCKKMDKTTFENEKIAQLLNDKYYAVKLDAEYTQDIEIQGDTFKFVPQGNKGYHELAAALLNGKMSYPTVVFLDEKFQLLTPVPGYQQPQDLHPILEFFGDSHYQNTEWETFLTNYKSPF